MGGGGRLERQPRIEEPGRRQWDAGGGGVHNLGQGGWIRGNVVSRKTGVDREVTQVRGEMWAWLWASKMQNSGSPTMAMASGNPAPCSHVGSSALEVSHVPSLGCPPSQLRCLPFHLSSCCSENVFISSPASPCSDPS